MIQKFKMEFTTKSVNRTWVFLPITPRKEIGGFYITPYDYPLRLPHLLHYPCFSSKLALMAKSKAGRVPNIILALKPCSPNAATTLTQQYFKGVATSTSNRLNESGFKVL